MPRGGKRPGAGAPRGNMNALKHGRRSRQFAQLGALIAQSPSARDALLNIAARWEDHKDKADYVAWRIIATIMTRGLSIGPDGLNVPPPLLDGRSIIESALGGASSNPASGENSSPIPPDNQKPTRRPADNQPQIQNQPD